LVDKDLARIKLAHIARNVAILEAKNHLTEKEFLSSIDQQYVILHALQLAIQAAMDLAAHVIADEGWDVPERSGEAFLILGRNGILEVPFSERLRSMAAFRNLIVHEYAAVDLKAVYKIWHNSVDDLKKFASAITTHFFPL
jgi:uncharacterized protein YutE (UPF0331/DUF86 family)